MAGPSQFPTNGNQQKATAIRNTSADEDQIKNISTGMTKVLYTSCSEYYHAQERQWQTRYQQKIHNKSETACCGVPRYLELNTLPRIPSNSPVYKKTDPMESPFMRLPAEIRIQIYSLLVFPRQATDLLPSYEKITSSTQDYFDYDKKIKGTDEPATADLGHPTLHIRTVEPTRYKNRYAGKEHARSIYSVRADRFRARCMETTYHCVNNPRIEDCLAVLRVNKQMHAEAAELLYSTYTFDFDTHIESIIPFLQDLTPYTRSCIKSIRIVKRALPYVKEFDKCEWHNALRYITSSSNNINLRRLELGVVAGRPGENGWDKVSRYSSRDFELLRGMEGMEWMQYLLEVKGLKELEVEAVIEHCPPCTSSSAMASYVRFSASVDGGFKEFLRSKLLV